VAALHESPPARLRSPFRPPAAAGGAGGQRPLCRPRPETGL